MSDRIKGRGASWNPQNRFETLEYVRDEEAPPDDDAPRTIYLRDPTRTIISTNDSPDVGFDASINPYRGCEHGCIYCYARPTHEYLGFSAGLDFETRILVKEDAPSLLRAELSAKKWQPKLLAISGVTDPYQPIEKRLGLTRGCLEVLAELRNPLGVITKNHLVTRDADLFAEMARWNGARVFVSITTLDAGLARTMEPRTSSPELRLDAIRSLAEAGVPAGVMVAPVIPGLTDHEMPAILAAATKAGARWAGFVVLRLPWAVAPLFENWLEENFPDRKEKVLNRIRDLRGGKLYESRVGHARPRPGHLRRTDRGAFRRDLPQARTEWREAESLDERVSRAADAGHALLDCCCGAPQTRGEVRDMKTLFESTHLLLIARDGWEYAERRKGKSAVAVIAETGDGRVILIEQFRRPVNARVVDWPAGLVGDEDGNDDPESAARRELEEEAGYACDSVERLVTAPTSPGITSELVTLYRAFGVRRVGEGGGIGDEKITVHTVARRDLESWLNQKKEEGVMIDIKVSVGTAAVGLALGQDVGAAAEAAQPLHAADEGRQVATLRAFHFLCRRPLGDHLRDDGIHLLLDDRGIDARLHRGDDDEVAGDLAVIDEGADVVAISFSTTRRLSRRALLEPERTLAGSPRGCSSGSSHPGM